jgi:hypothetical protein
MENQEVIKAIKAKTAFLKQEMARIPDARIFYKLFINGELSKDSTEEVAPESVDSFIDYWVGQGFYLEQKTQETESIIWLKIWEFGDQEPTWDEVFE